MRRFKATLSPPPHGNHGDNDDENPPMEVAQKNPVLAERTRLTVDLSPAVVSLLDHVSGITGVSRTQIVAQLVVDALPQLCARADEIAKRAVQLQQPQQQKKR